jgi:hypothetical protein
MSKILDSDLQITNINLAIHYLVIFNKIKASQEFSLEDFSFICSRKGKVLKEKWNFLKQNILETIMKLPESTNSENISKTISLNSYYEMDNLMINTNLDGGVNMFQTSYDQKKYSSILRFIKMKDVDLSSYEQNLIDVYIEKIKNLSLGDFNRIKALIQQTMDKIYDSCGKHDDFYTEYKGIIHYPEQIIFRQSHISLLSYLIDLKKDINNLIYEKILQERIKIINEISIQIGINMTLLDLSLLYYKEQSRWTEIAQYNKLKFPYIDDNGTVTFFSSTGDKNIITVNNIELDIGEDIFISSLTQPEEKRTINNIIYNKNSEYCSLILNGESDLERFTLDDKAQILWYLPHTTNYKKYLKIPNILLELNTIKNNNVDLKLDEDGDLAFNLEGDIALTDTLESLIQSSLILLNNQQGFNTSHPKMGLPDLLKIVNDSYDLEGDLSNILHETITKDNRFSGISDIQINKFPNYITISCLIFTKIGFSFPFSKKINF